MHGIAALDMRGRVPGPAHFCDDFDRGGDIGFRWTRRFLDDGGVIGETDAAFSPPRALVAGFANGAQNGTDAWLVHEKDSSLSLADKKRIVLSFLLRVPETAYPNGTNGYFHTTILTFDPTTCPTNGTRAVELRFRANGEYVVDLKGLAAADGKCSPDGQSHYEEFLAPRGIDYFRQELRKVTLEIRREACTNTSGPASLTVDVGGTATPCRTLAVDPFTKGDRLALNIGAFAGASAVTAETRFVFDDVKLDVE